VSTDLVNPLVVHQDRRQRQDLGDALKGGRLLLMPVAAGSLATPTIYGERKPLSSLTALHDSWKKLHAMAMRQRPHEIVLRIAYPPCERAPLY